MSHEDDELDVQLCNENFNCKFISLIHNNLLNFILKYT